MPGLLPTDPHARLAADTRWMRRALALAAQGDYLTSPNPMVGAVVLDASGEPAGEGFHARAGEPRLLKSFTGLRPSTSMFISSE